MALSVKKEENSPPRPAGPPGQRLQPDLVSWPVPAGTDRAASQTPPRGPVGIVHCAKVLLLRFQWVLVNSWLLCPVPHLLLHWNQFVQRGNFATFLIAGNFHLQHYHPEVFPRRRGLVTRAFFSLPFLFYFINLGKGIILALVPLYLLDFR